MANSMSVLRRQAAPAAAGPPIALYAGISVFIAVVLIAGITIVVVIVRKKKAHRRVMEEMEQGVRISLSPVRQIGQFPRRLPSVRRNPSVRCHQMMPDSQSGWDALASNESLHQPQIAMHPVKRLRSTLGLPKSSKQRPSPFDRNKHLSSIVELDSPVGDRTTPQLPLPEKGKPFRVSAIIPAREQPDTVRPTSPKADVRPSLAIRAFHFQSDTEGVKATRSASENVLSKAKPEGSVFGLSMDTTATKRRSLLHGRSASLGAPAGAPPSGPVPPLPTIAPLKITTDDSARRGLCISRMSTSSVGSTSSSVLISSPILSRKEDGNGMKSPTVEDVVADAEDASMKNVANRQWQAQGSTASQSVFPLPPSTLQKSESMQGSLMHFTIVGDVERRGSSGSEGSDEENRNPDREIAEIATAGSITLSRVSSCQSLTDSASRVQKITTPHRGAKSRQVSVSDGGSPAPRRRPTVLTDISGNASRPSPTRQPSDSTLNSARSSNGNPFQWDNSDTPQMAKPSALKGSPNARKGHRRQNCVRISTLTPQVLGPVISRSRSVSPATLMSRINEEGGDESDDVFEDSEPEQATRKLAVPKTRRRSTPRQNTLPASFRVPSMGPAMPQPSPSAMWNAQHTRNSSCYSGMADDASGSPPAWTIPTFPTASTTTTSMDYSPSRPVSALSFGHDDDELNGRPVARFVMRSSSSEELLSSSASRPVSAMSFGADDDEKNGRPVARFVMRSSSSEHSPITPTSPVSPMSPPYSADIPSSPPRMPRPLSVRKSSASQGDKEYDPAWPVISLPHAEGEDGEYDPASPPTEAWEMNNAEGRGSWFLPFATVATEAPSANSSPRSGNTTPKIVTHDTTEELTSSNASEVMSRLPATPTRPAAVPKGSLFLNSASMPILLPPATNDVADVSLPAWVPPSVPTHSLSINTRPMRRGSSTRHNRRRLSPQPFMPTIPQSSSPPNRTSSEISTQDPTPDASQSGSGDITPSRTESPKPPIPVRSSARTASFVLPSQSPTSTSRPSLLHGPRSAPAKSVLRNVSELRRMNSDVQSETSNRESRTWARLGRESSLLRPLARDDDERTENGDQEGGFEFAFEQHAGDSEKANGKSPIESVDLAEFERHLAGALDGLHKELQPTVAATSDATPTQAQKRNSSVWNNGEKAWSEKEKEGIVTTTLTTPKGRVEKLGAFGGGEAGPGTPGSLYDQDGFLKA